MHATVTRRSLGAFLGLGLPAPGLASPPADPIFAAIEAHRAVAREEASAVSALERALSPRAEPHANCAPRGSGCASCGIASAGTFDARPRPRPPLPSTGRLSREPRPGPGSRRRCRAVPAGYGGGLR